VGHRDTRPELAPLRRDVGQSLDRALVGHVAGKLVEGQIPPLPVPPPPQGQFQSGDREATDQPAADVWMVKELPGDESRNGSSTN